VTLQPSNEKRLGNLRPATTYSIKLTAKTVKGEGPYTPIITVKTYDDGMLIDVTVTIFCVKLVNRHTAACSLFIMAFKTINIDFFY